MWMESSKERRCSGTATGASTLFPNCVCGCPKGLLDAENFGKLFLTFFSTILAGIAHLGSQRLKPVECCNALSMRSESDNPFCARWR